MSKNKSNIGYIEFSYSGRQIRPCTKFIFTFQQYLLFKKDHSELLFYILRQLSQDQLAFLRGTNESQALVIEIDEKDLKDKAKQLNIHDLKPFYQSRIFENNNFVYDAARKVIIHTIPEAITAEL
ncbi:hypothetical protein GEV33_001430 [Tenebrio molitor]|uniref:DNA replication licensing factor MCM2-like winged-helix domain-containing protein n=1 Tax=Tenebrio molitor TaxID=7067 RepID=A0A8J6LQ79_TENMO|nr:hypothetical protein GEV33_001430 [Tenebrio molitor]